MFFVGLRFHGGWVFFVGLRFHGGWVFFVGLRFHGGWVFFVGLRFHGGRKRIGLETLRRPRETRMLLATHEKETSSNKRLKNTSGNERLSMKRKKLEIINYK